MLWISDFRKVKTLADSDSDDEGALAWIKKSRKLEKEKELAEKRVSTHEICYKIVNVLP